MVYTEGDEEPFDWDEGNEEHVARHGVEPWEAEEALLDPHRYPLSRGLYNGEYRYAVVGRTPAGRTLTVVFANRDRKIRVVTARNASSREVRLFERNQ